MLDLWRLSQRRGAWNRSTEQLVLGRHLASIYWCIIFWMILIEIDWYWLRLIDIVINGILSWFVWLWVVMSVSLICSHLIHLGPRLEHQRHGRLDQNQLLETTSLISNLNSPIDWIEKVETTSQDVAHEHIVKVDRNQKKHMCINVQCKKSDRIRFLQDDQSILVLRSKGGTPQLRC